MSKLRVVEDEETISPIIAARIIERLTYREARLLSHLEETGGCDLEFVRDMVDLDSWVWLLFFGVIRSEIDEMDRIRVGLTIDGSEVFYAWRHRNDAAS